MARDSDGSYHYVRDDIGTSPMGQAKLFLRQFEDAREEGVLETRESYPDHLAYHLRAVLEESDRRLFQSMPWWDKLIRKFR
jgi:hypothetical protein